MDFLIRTVDLYEVPNKLLQSFSNLQKWYPNHHRVRRSVTRVLRDPSHSESSTSLEVALCIHEVASVHWVKKTVMKRICCVSVAISLVETFESSCWCGSEWVWTQLTNEHVLCMFTQKVPKCDAKLQGRRGDAGVVTYGGPGGIIEFQNLSLLDCISFPFHHEHSITSELWARKFWASGCKKREATSGKAIGPRLICFTETALNVQAVRSLEA